MKLTRITILMLAVAICIGMFASCAPSQSKDLTDAKTLADLVGARIAAQSGTFHQKALTQIENVQASDLPDFDQLLVALNMGTIDGYIAEKPTALTVCKANEALTYVPLINNDTGFTATDDQVGIAMGLKKGSELRERINAILAEITPEQRAQLMQQAVDMAAGDKLDSLAITVPETDGANGVLKVAMECAYRPFNWTDTSADATYGSVAISGEGKDGLYANGYDVQIARYVAAKLGMKLEIYQYAWDSLIPAVQSGSVDAIVAGMSPTEDRAKEVDFTDTYYTSDLVVVIKK